ncbi:MAG: N-acetyl sugar amidotransferase [Odoribacter sp.]
MKEITRCKRCVMDDASDTTIKFDEAGHCNYCTYALGRMNDVYFPNEVGREKLEVLISKIKAEGKGKKYDCLMGISGGLDSAYLAYLGYKWGLRILAFHIDDGFNSEIAVANVKKLCECCHIDLQIKKPDKKQFNDVTRAFILAGVPGICVPQDNLILSYLYKTAKENNLNYFLSGTNFSLESILQRGEAINASDGYHIRAISKLFGKEGTDQLPFVNLFERYVKIKYFQKLHVVRPLDLIDYNKNRAIKELNEFCGFNYYGGKHYESLLTHFAQVYYMPLKFKIDKRTSHLSSLIVSGQLSREEAMQELNKPLYDSLQMEKELDIILEKLGLTREEFEVIMAQAPKSHFDYPHSLFNNFAAVARKFRKFLSD